mgnify:FL=1
MDRGKLLNLVSISNFEKMSLSQSDNNDREPFEIAEFQKDLDNLLKQIKSEMVKLKEKEAARIFKKYVSKELNKEMLTSLGKLLVILFGRVQAENEYFNFIRHKQVEIGSHLIGLIVISRHMSKPPLRRKASIYLRREQQQRINSQVAEITL